MKKLLKMMFLSLSLTALLMTAAFAAEGERVRVAVIDSGVSSAAISADALAEGANYIKPEESTEDRVGHGTAVVSLIVGSERAGVSGVCPEAEVVPMVFYTASRSGLQTAGDTTMMAQMILDAIDIYSCDIINISACGNVDDEAVRNAIAYAEEKGVLVVAAAGNEGKSEARYPAQYDSVLCVGSVDETLRNAAKFSNDNAAVDVVAPGVDLTVSAMSGAAKKQSGTSFSTAYITGLAAKLMTEYPDLSAAQVRQIICASAEDLMTPGHDNSTGWGVVTAEDTLAFAAEGRQFRDVKAKDWFFAGAKTMADLGLMNGMDAVNFAPQRETTHAMLWTMLYRMDGRTASANAASWYADAQQWVMDSKISKGDNPNGIITRGEIVHAMWRYAIYKGMDVTGVSGDLSAYSDAASVSGETAQAMQWACGAGVINGINGALAAGGNTTRAQIATILARFLSL
ncbi:MAG: S8 family serine peptidase [Oscillospiraceae bacterium]|nr:S8 family serine peptidase [Oscillospiraceae bacterium]